MWQPPPPPPYHQLLTFQVYPPFLAKNVEPSLVIQFLEDPTPPHLLNYIELYISESANPKKLVFYWLKIL